MRGLKHFFKTKIENLGEDVVLGWLENLGYDEHFCNVQSRAFTLTYHSDSNFRVIAKDALKTDFDNITNGLICLK